MKIQKAASLLILFIIFTGQLYLSIPAEAEQRNILSSSFKNSLEIWRWDVAKDPDPLKPIQSIPDSMWEPIDAYDKSGQHAIGNYLFKTDIYIDESFNKNIVLGLFPQNFITAYEIYWDGQKVAQNGIIGADIKTEQPGTFNFDAPLPPHLLLPGKHTILVRLSNYRHHSMWRWYYGSFVISSYAAKLKESINERYQHFLFTGLIIIPFLFNLFLFITRKNKIEHLLFSLICLIVIFDHMINSIVYFIDLPTTYVYWGIDFYRSFALLNSILFPAFFIYMFKLPRKKFILLIICINLIIFFFFKNKFNVFIFMPLTIIIESSFISFWALFKKREGSIIIFLGIILTWIAYFYMMQYRGLATTTGLATIMVICTSLSIAVEFAKKEKAEKEAQLRSTRLENELLKKNINPHFLMNSLTSIIVWMRREPATAIKLIEALAEEFRMVIQISKLAQIPIRQEIDLCQTHLRIMSYRKGADFALTTTGIVESDYIPPMIFHTLIENGLTHGYENKNSGKFSIQRKITSNEVQYIISNDGEFTDIENKKSSGMGLKYVKTRLEESFPGRWNLESNQRADGWEVVIAIEV